MRERWYYLLGFLFLVSIAVWLGVFATKGNKLKLIACDVGQGDAILATYGEYQVLVDGGPNSGVLGCLASYIPYWDRKIEVVILTHPQFDHFRGLIDVFESYEVEVLVANSLDSSSQEYQVLEKMVGGSQVRVVTPDSGLGIRLGLIHLDILHPDGEYVLLNSIDHQANVLGASTTKEDPNDFSVVAKLSLGEFDALLTGDIGPSVTREILEKVEIGDVEYIKIPHHGSKNGLIRELLEETKPEVAVISSGEGNRYGHPHKEVLDMLLEANVDVFRTDKLGDVVFETDGQTWSVAK